MKKTLAAISVISTLALSAVPAFAAGNGNINISGNGNTINITQTDSSTTNNNYNFGDINGHWAQKYIMDLVKKDILAGVDKNHFKPNASVKRDEFATMVVRYFHLSTANSGTQDFGDVTVNSWEYKYVEAAKNYFDAYQSLNGGLDFHPNEGAQREDVTVTLVKILMQLNPNLQLMDSTSADALLQSRFKDADKIAPVLRPYVATAVDNKLISGDGDGYFAPDRVLTRAEAATLLDRLQGNTIVVGGSTGTTTTGTGTDGGTTTTTGTGTDGGTTTTTGTGTDGGTTTTTGTGTDGGTTTTGTGTDGGTTTTSGTGTGSGTIN